MTILAFKTNTKISVEERVARLEARVENLQVDVQRLEVEVDRLREAFGAYSEKRKRSARRWMSYFRM